MTTNQLLAICLFFLDVEQRALFQHRQPLASWARRMVNEPAQSPGAEGT